MVYRVWWTGPLQEGESSLELTLCLTTKSLRLAKERIDALMENVGEGEKARFIITDGSGDKLIKAYSGTGMRNGEEVKSISIGPLSNFVRDWHEDFMDVWEEQDWVKEQGLA